MLTYWIRSYNFVLLLILLLLTFLRKLIEEPQMHLFSNFRNDGSFILAGRSFQIVGLQTLNDLGPNVTVLVLGMYSCPEVADRNCLRPGIAETTMQSAAR